MYGKSSMGPPPRRPSNYIPRISNISPCYKDYGLRIHSAAQRAKLMRISWSSERNATEREWGLVSENPRQASCILCVRDVLQEGRHWSPLTAKTANVEFITMQ